MPTRLTPTQAEAVRAIERKLTAAVSRLREVRESGVVYPRTLRALMEDCDGAADNLDRILTALEAAE